MHNPIIKIINYNALILIRCNISVLLNASCKRRVFRWNYASVTLALMNRIARGAGYRLDD
jgi:formaldehyde-activating enzyme involved in methanogenesis